MIRPLLARNPVRNNTPFCKNRKRWLSTKLPLSRLIGRGNSGESRGELKGTGVAFARPRDRPFRFDGLLGRG